jgi:hypothetical protein
MKILIELLLCYSYLRLVLLPEDWWGSVADAVDACRPDDSSKRPGGVDDHGRAWPGSWAQSADLGTLGACQYGFREAGTDR